MLMSEQMFLSSRDMPDIACSATFAPGLWMHSRRHRRYSKVEQAGDQCRGRNHYNLITAWGSLPDQVDELGGTEQASAVPRRSMGAERIWQRQCSIAKYCTVQCSRRTVRSFVKDTGLLAYTETPVLCRACATEILL